MTINIHRTLVVQILHGYKRVITAVNNDYIFLFTEENPSKRNTICSNFEHQTRMDANGIFDESPQKLIVGPGSTAVLS